MMTKVHIMTSKLRDSKKVPPSPTFKLGARVRHALTGFSGRIVRILGGRNPAYEVEDRSGRFRAHVMELSLIPRKEHSYVG